MKKFAELYENLDATTSTNEKIQALRNYFSKADPADSMWTLLLLTGKVSKRVITSRNLRHLFLHATKYPEWLYDESYHHVGDTAETLSLLANSLNICREVSTSDEKSLTAWLEQEIPNLSKVKDENTQSEILLGWWSQLTAHEVYILNKLMTGAFRVGVSEKLVIRGLAEVYQIPTDLIAHRLTGTIHPSAEAFAQLISSEPTELNFSQPYPFCLAHSWSDRREKNFQGEDWCIEWKFDGIRAQVLRREDKVWIWSRGEEQITETFPEVASAMQSLPPGTVLDGEILVFKDGKVLPFQELQKRLGRKKVSAAMMKDLPAGFIAYDCLEFDGKDIRELPLRHRKRYLDHALSEISNPHIYASPVLAAKDSDELDSLRTHGREMDAEGVMIKLWAGSYSVGRKTGNWWKYKVDPLTLDGVLIYAQAGSGRRSNLYTDYTFALWNEEHVLVPFAKAYSGLDQKEIDELDAWIRRHTVEKFGPVRSVEPHFVFEIAFEGIGPSKRHKSGIAVRFPRILRWRKDKTAKDADSLKTASELFEAAGSP